MRVLDPSTPLHAPRPSRKKKKPQRFRRYFKARFKVPTEPCTDLVPPHHTERYERDWAPNCKGPEGIRDEVEVCIHGDDQESLYRISIWGDDDLGYDREWSHDETTVEELVRYVVLSFPEPLTFEWLEAEKFQPC
jgi:hypothetical protein